MLHTKDYHEQYTMSDDTMANINYTNMDTDETPRTVRLARHFLQWVLILNFEPSSEINGDRVANSEV